MNTMLKSAMKPFSKALTAPDEHTSVSSRDAKLHYHYAQVMEKGTHEANADLQAELAHRDATDRIFEQFAEITGIDLSIVSEITDYECLRDMKNGFQLSQQERMSDYQLKYVRYFVEACEQKGALNATDALGLFDE